MDNIIPFLANIAGKRMGDQQDIEYASIINMFSEPSLIVDKISAKIIFLNTGCLQLTTFKHEEICGEAFNFLFPGVSLNDLERDHDNILKLNVRKSNPISVVAKVYSLGNTEERLLIKVIPEALFSQQQSPEVWNDKIKGIQKLTSLTYETDLDNLLSQAVGIAQLLLNTEFVCVYQAESAHPELKKIISRGAENTLPKSLPSSDLIKLAKTTIWMPGKKAVTEIQRFAKISNLAYLACTPLGQKDALFGLLVVGAEIGQPSNCLMEYLKILGNSVSSAISHYTLLENLNLEIEAQRRSMTMRDIVVDNIQEGVLVLDADLNIQEINSAAEKMLEYSKNEVCGQPIGTILIGTEMLSSALGEASSGIIRRDLRSVTLHKRSGQSFLANIQIVPIKGEEEQKNFMIIIRDQSESEQIRVRTRQLEHRAFLGEFSSIFAHEVRNPINNISTGMELLSRRLASDDPKQDVITRALNDCTRLTDLMDSFLSFSHTLDTSSFETIDIVKLARIALDMWTPRLTSVKITPYFQASDDLPKVRGDLRALERVFINLISNAFDAMKENGGSLSVRVVLNDSIVNNPQIEVLVSDSGPGIPEDIKDHLFEPFVTTRPKGTGLGLAITKKILTDHRGSISVSSVAGGTIFHVYLPAVIGAI
jgi:two-component system, NtrC family, sensor histidine kinase AtoS